MSGKKEPSTFFSSNTYETNILPPIIDKQVRNKNVTFHADGSPANTTIVPLTKNNASKCGDTSRIGWASRVDYSVKQQYEERKKEIAVEQQRTFAQDPNRLLEVTISTIILAAIKSPVPKEHLVYSLLYLKNIKDEYGDHPPNISGFIKYLNGLKKKQEIEWEQSYYTEPEKKTHVVKLQNPNKLSRIPRPIVQSGDCPQKDLVKKCKRMQMDLKKSGCVDSTLNAVE